MVPVLCLLVIAYILIEQGRAQVLSIDGDDVDTSTPVIPDPIERDRLAELANAIAVAEGAYTPGHLPYRLNNPGDLKNTRTGQLIQFATWEEGWAALVNQLRLMAEGRSRVYSPDDTFERIARMWVGDSDWPNWLNNVTAVIGVSGDMTLREFMEG